MSLFCNVLAIHRFDQESHVHVPNVGSAARAGSQTVVGPNAQAACCLQSRRSWTVHSKMCQRALGLQRNRNRLVALECIREQSRNKSTGCLCGDRQSGGRNERFDCHSQYVEHFRGFDGVIGSASHSTVDGKIKGREVRRGRVAQKRRHIRHFARGATKHDSLPIRATPWKIETSRTSRASTQ
jgi:hypothetical protein